MFIEVNPLYPRNLILRREFSIEQIYNAVFFFPLHRIVYTTEPVEDKVFLVGDAHGKKVRSFKADMKTNFENVNFKDENNVEENGDDDCRRKIIPLEEDIV